MKEDVIVSVSTPLGKGAIAIVRMSGQESLDIALSIFHSAKISSDSIKPRYMYFGKLTVEEKYCIRWHMGFTEPKEQYGTIGLAYKKYPLALLMFEADLEATYFFNT